MLSVSEVGMVLEVDCQVIEVWADRFKNYLTKNANPDKDVERRFSRMDVQVLAMVSHFWENESDYEDVIYMLNSDVYGKDIYRKFALLNTPMILDPCDDELYEGEEAWTHGFLIGGIVSKFHQVEIARSYKLAADSLVEKIKNSPAPLDYAYPILFLYRHCLELYLKVVLNDEKKKLHQIDSLIKKIEEKHQEELPIWMKLRLLDFHILDPNSTSFRYLDKFSKSPGEGKIPGEFCIEFMQLKVIIESLCSEFENLIKCPDSF